MLEILTEMPKIKIEVKSKPHVKAKTLNGNLYFRGESIRVPQAWVVMEDFAAGDVVRWNFFYDEIHYILRGKAEVTYSLASTTYTEQKKMTAEAGDCYLIPRGASVEWKVDPSGPYQKLCVIMPCPPPTKRAPGTEEKL
jgi:ethanolamine utilization protein EutQ (cupin superfamily)